MLKSGKALSGYTEWFWCLLKNIKPVENRRWPLSRYIKWDQLPQRIFLHASKTPASREEVEFIKSLLTPEQLAEFEAVDWARMRGGIIGEIDLTGCVTAEERGMPEVRSPWFFGPYGFTMANGELYKTAIPYRGMLGFFNVTLPQVCRRCGCSENNACSTPDGPCWWAEPGLCSACAGVGQPSIETIGERLGQEARVDGCGCYCIATGPDRQAMWKRVFPPLGRVPIVSPMASEALLAGGESLVYLVDFTRVSHAAKEDLIHELAQRFNLAPIEIRRDIEQQGCPVKADQVIVSICPAHARALR